MVARFWILSAVQEKPTSFINDLILISTLFIRSILGWKCTKVTTWYKNCWCNCSYYQRAIQRSYWYCQGRDSLGLPRRTSFKCFQNHQLQGILFKKFSYWFNGKIFCWSHLCCWFSRLGFAIFQGHIWYNIRWYHFSKL